MAGTMSLADLVSDLAASLHDSAEVFVNPGDFQRLLESAALDFSRHRPRTLLGKFTVEIGRIDYPAPADMYQFKSSLWGNAPVPRAKPWERSWPGPMPDVRMVDGQVGRELHLVPAPTALQLMTLGSEFRFYYFAKHTVAEDAANTTLAPDDRFLLLLRAQAEAMRELMIRNIKKPVTMREGLNSSPRNSTPAAMYEKLMDEWNGKVKVMGA